MTRALALVVCLAVAVPAVAQPADAPVVCKPGDVVLSPEAALAAAKRLTAAEEKVKVYEANPPLPWWGVVIIGVVAAGAGAAITVGIYEASKKP